MVLFKSLFSNNSFSVDILPCHENGGTSSNWFKAHLRGSLGIFSSGPIPNPTFLKNLFQIFNFVYIC